MGLVLIRHSPLKFGEILINLGERFLWDVFYVHEIWKFDFKNCTGRDFVASFVADGCFEKGSLGNNVVHETVLGHTYESSANAAYEKIKLQNMPIYNVILKKIDEPLKIGDRSISTGLYLVKKSA